jgi:hypothetical protein
MPVNPASPPPIDPDLKTAQRLAALERKVAKLETMQTQTLVAPDGTRVRAEFGKTASGRYGLRVYDNTGALIHDYTTAA